MKIHFSEGFKKRFEKLPIKIQEKFRQRLAMFLKNARDPILHNHYLKGYLAGFRAFSVTGNYRVVYQILDIENIKLVDIGTHNQVY